MGYYAASNNKFLPTFRDNLSVLSPKGFLYSSSLKIGPICRAETSVINYHYSLRNNPKEFCYILNKNSSNRSGVFPCCKTDERTKMIQLIVTFRNFEITPNNYSLTEFKQFVYVLTREVTSGCRKL